MDEEKMDCLKNSSQMPFEEIELRGERVYLKKDSIGWRIVNPVKNSDGSRNWFNTLFGGKRNLRNLIIIMILAAMLLYGIYTMVKSCKDFAANPCEYTNLDCSQDEIEISIEQEMMRLNPNLSRIKW